MTVNNKFLGVSLLITLLGGCAAKPGETFDSKFAFDHQSMANDMVWLAGYNGLVSDNSYDRALDAAISAGTMGTLLPQDFNISGFGAAGLGFVLTSLQGTFPVEENLSHIVFQPLKSGDNPADPAFVSALIKQSFDKVIPWGSDVRAGKKPQDIANTAASDIACEHDNGLAGYNPFDLTHSCTVKGFDGNVAVRVAYTYTGDHFKAIMPNYVNKPMVAVLLRESGFGLQAKRENVFSYKERALVNNIAIVPFIKPNDEGKKLVFINGKATLV
jgi:hypothetical protein